MAILVISPNDNTSQNGNIVSSYNYPYGQLKLQNSDTLSLYQVDLTTLAKQSVVLDSVSYTATEGVSTLEHMDPYNDIWCSSTSSYFEGSFGNISVVELGSPLSENDECPTSHLDIDGDGLSEDEGDSATTATIQSIQMLQKSVMVSKIMWCRTSTQ